MGYRGTRQALIRRFPYGIIYLPVAEPDTIVVLAVLHCGRDPTLWRQRSMRMILATHDLHHQTKDLSHNRHHRLQLGVVQSPDRMGASSPGAPVERSELLAEHKAMGTRPIGDGAQVHGQGGATVVRS